VYKRQRRSGKKLIKNKIMAKWLTFLICLLLPFRIFCENDSIQKQNISRITIGFQFVPISYLKWTFPENQTVKSYEDSSEEKKDNTRKFVPIAKCGLHLSYSLIKVISLETGISYLKEEVDGILLFDTINSTVRNHYLRSYINKFVQIPLSINFSIPDNSKKRNLTNLKLGMNCDFIYYEKNSYGTESVYSINRKIISQTNLNGKERPYKYSFHRFVPFVFIGRQFFNKKSTFSFSYGTLVEFNSVFQKHNTSEYLKNYKISVITIGIAYHL
jgi:hypothetical protein